CIHDATPAYARETRVMIRDLAPLLGRRFSFGVVPNWYGDWPLASHPSYCDMIQDAAEELLLHGYFHRRQHGWGPITLLAERCDEMNGLTARDTQRTLERGQRVFANVFGAPARGFLAPGWQRGHVRLTCRNSLGLEHIVGFFSLESHTGRRIPLATWTWDCGRWDWLAHVGHGIGRMLQSLDHRIPTLAIHPRDLHRGFWPKIVRLTERLLDTGHAPTTVAKLLEASGAEVAA
ncbi:MAG TPA: DUF2334 domain-containing protein, partial [Gemmatimonadaceae bacterium]|nr:DUF2334 domain-containing protein [Gemmatimonadaceae bacterium]